jgi:hypothetical protein
LAAQHNTSARCYLGTKTKVPTPSGGQRKELRQPAMLKIRKPCDRRKRQTPAKKTCGLENEIDTFGLKFRRCRPIQPKRKRGNETRTTPIKRRRLHYLDAWNSCESRKLGGFFTHPREHNRLDFAGAVPV